MSEVGERVRVVGEQVGADYDARRTEAALARLHARLRRRRVRAIAFGSAMATLCLLAGTFWATRTARETPAPHPVAKPEPLFALSDGSAVTALDGASRLLAKHVSPELVELELVAGGAHFQVTPNREREFRVSAGRVRIVVVGTTFSVERQGDRTAVAVQGGRVRVQWERGEQILDPGERGSFPPFEPAGEATPELEPVPTVQPQLAPVRTGPDWRALAKHGDFAAAYRLLHDKGKLVYPANVEDLLLAADVARRSGHAAASVPYLERAMTLHKGDARAAVIAFTLGRVRLADLDDPDGAAAAFAEARAAAPAGPLAEDALAREIEARFRAGDPTRAHALAEEYVLTWPSGRRLREVRHFGGLP